MKLLAMGQCQALRSPPSPLSEITWDPPIHGRVGHLGPPSSSTSINLPQFELNPLDKAEDVNPPPPHTHLEAMEGAENVRHLPLQDVSGQPVNVQQACSLTADNSNNGGLLQLLRRRQLGDHRRLVVLLAVQPPLFLLLLRWK